MKKFYSLCAMAALGLAFACTREAVPADPATPEGGVGPDAHWATYTLRPASGTRAGLSDEGAFSWAVGDCIAVYDDNSKQIYTFEGVEKGEQGFLFSATLPEGDYQFTRAWFPASLVGTDQATGTLTLPDTYDYDAVKDASSVALVASVNKASAEDVSGELSFSHMGAVIRLTINSVPAGNSTLTFTSDAKICGTFDLSETGVFRAAGEDAQEGEEHAITKADYGDPRFVDEIKAVSGSNSTVQVNIHMDNAGTAVCYLPVPTGSYNYNITLTPDGFSTPILSKGTTSQKTINRADFIKMAALAASASADTQMRLRGNYVYEGAAYNFPSKEADGPIAFQPLHSGWYKVDGLGFYGSGEDRRIRFKMCILKSDGSAIQTHYHIDTDAQRGNILGVLMPVAQGGGNDANIYLPDYPDDAKFTVYYNIDEGKVFIQESSLPFLVPDAEMSDVDQYGCLYLDGTISEAHDLRVVPGQPGWRAVYDVPAGSNILFQKPKVYNSDGTGIVGAAAAGTHEVSRLFDAGTEAFSFSQAVDVYVSTDAKTLFALPAGTAFAVPTQAEGAEAMGKTEFLKNTAYGVYNLQGVYTGSFEAKDQTAVSGSTFTLIKGWTFDQYVVEGVPASASEGDSVPLTVKYVNNLTSAIRTATIQAEVLSVSADKITLYDSTGDVGVIVRPAVGSGEALNLAERAVYVPTVPVVGARSGKIKVPVILLAFSDLDFQSGSKDVLEERFNTGEHSIHQYFLDNSGGKLDVTFDLLGPVKTSYTVAQAAQKEVSGKAEYFYYASALSDALDELDANVNFTDYAYSDPLTLNSALNLVTIHAGCNSQSGYGSIASRNSTTFGKTIDGVIAQSYCVTPELESGSAVAYISHATHEFGHALGLPDWYDVSNQSNKPLGRYSVMDYGDYNGGGMIPAGYSTVERIMANMETQSSLVPITSSGKKTLYRMGGDANNVHALYIPTQEGSTESYLGETITRTEGFICEFRSHDSYWDSALPNNGMVVFHMNRSTNIVSGTGRSANDHWKAASSRALNSGLSSHPIYYVVHADSPTSRLAGTSSNTYIPFPGSGNVIRYNPVSWTDVTSYVSITDIPSSTSGESMTFNAHVREFPMINDPKHGSYSSGDALYLGLSQGSKTCSDNVSWKVNGETKYTGSLITFTTGTTLIEANIANKQHLYLEITVK